MAIKEFSKEFALSGQFVYARIYVTEDSINVRNNTSTITVKIQAQRTNTGYTTSSYGTLSGKVNGVSYSGTIPASLGVSSPTWVTFFSKTYTIEHDSQGKKSIVVTTSISWQRSGSASLTCVLSDIPRVSQPSCITYPDNTEDVGDIGESFYIHMNRASDDFKHTVSYSFGSLSGVIAENVDDNVLWQIPMSFCAELPDSESGSGTITVDTYNDGVLMGSATCAFTCKVPSSMIPTFTSNLSYQLNNSINAIVESWGIALAGFTKVNLKAKAVGINGSRIVSYSIAGNYSADVSGAELNYTGSIISMSGTKRFTVVATDSRGRKTESQSVDVAYLAYIEPTVTNFLMSRNPSVSTNMDIKFNSTFSSLNGKNKLTKTLKYKKHSDDVWISYGNVENGDTLSDNLGTAELEFMESSSYDFQIVVTDSLGRTATAKSFVSSLMVTMDFRAGGKGVGIGKIAEEDGFVCAFDAIFTSDVYLEDEEGNRSEVRSEFKRLDRRIDELEGGGGTSGSGGSSGLYTFANGKTFKSLMSLTTSQAYDLFNDYVNKGLLTRKIIGYASASSTATVDAVEDTSNPIYMYSFKKHTKDFGGYRTSNFNKAVLILGAIHGNEKLSVPFMLSLLAEYTAGNSFVKSLLDNFEWDFVPIVNPYGFDLSVGTTMDNVESNIGRTNARGVDLNRNFQTLWGEISESPNSFNYKGQASCSEQETKTVRRLLTSGNYIFCLDIHTERYVEAEAPMFGRLMSPSSVTRSIYTQIVERLYDRIKTTYHQNIVVNGLDYTTSLGGSPFAIIDFVNITGFNQMAALFEAPRYVGGVLYPEDNQMCCIELLTNYIKRVLDLIPDYIYSKSAQESAIKAGMLLDGNIAPNKPSDYRYGTYNNDGITNDWTYQRVYTSTGTALDPSKMYIVSATSTDGSVLEVSTEIRDNGTHKSWLGWGTSNTVNTTGMTSPVIYVTFRKIVDGSQQNIVLTDIGQVYFLDIHEATSSSGSSSQDEVNTSQRTIYLANLFLDAGLITEAQYLAMPPIGIYEVSGTSALNVRSSMSTTESNVLGTATSGTRLPVYEIISDWSKINYNGRIAYAMNRYLQYVSAS